MARWCFNMFPRTLLAKGVSDLATASDSNYEGLRWVDRSRYCQVSTPPPLIQEEIAYWQVDCVTSLADIYIILGLQTIAFLGLAVCIDKLREDGGVKLHWPCKVSARHNTMDFTGPLCSDTQIS